MRKISIKSTNGLIVKYIIKVFAISFLSVFLLSMLSSYLIYKFDLDLSYIEYVCIAVVIISAFLISYFSVGGFKNNYMPLSLISVLPLTLFTVINFIINCGEVTNLFVKLGGIAVVSIFSSLLRLRKK